MDEYDDILSPNIRISESHRKAIKTFEVYATIDQHKGKLIVVGTKRRLDDLYERLLEKSMPEFRKWEYDLFRLLDSLHGSEMGSSDPLSDEDREAYLAEVKKRVENWTPSPPRSKRYDDAVKEMCLAVVAECKER